MQFSTSLILFAAVVTSAFHTVLVSAIPYSSTHPHYLTASSLSPDKSLERPGIDTGNLISLRASHPRIDLTARGPGILKPPSGPAPDYAAVLRNLSPEYRQKLLRQVTGEIMEGKKPPPMDSNTELAIRAMWWDLRNLWMPKVVFALSTKREENMN
ncbi:hypothetical protein BC835DRAFT_1318207 [Cytidiella melzeri]|nr:hypothetical protein BC835DRAFT_1318207 [Cytidiella melzeri]